MPNASAGLVIVFKPIDKLSFYPPYHVLVLLFVEVERDKEIFLSQTVFLTALQKLTNGFNLHVHRAAAHNG